VINEFSPSNTSTIQNGIDNYDDWIELYNAGASSVNLNGYGLSDVLATPYLFRFPSYVLQPNAHLLIFASNENKIDVVDHWETAVTANTQWKYYAAVAAPDTNWRNLSFNDASWSTGRGGIGFGDGDDSTVVSQGRAVVMRKTFTIADTSQIVNAILNIDYDDGYVAYLNGVEISRNNIGTVGVRPGYTELATLGHEAQLYQGLKPDSVFLDHNLFKSIIRPGTNVLAIEVHNQTAVSGDLSAIPYLSFGMLNPGNFYGPLPSFFVVPPKEYYNANFKLSRGGESIYLFNDASVLLDSINYTTILTDNSKGRIPDGNSTWCLINTPSPGTTNNLSTCYSAYAEQPIFSIPGGFYPGPRFLSLSSPQIGLIRYTTNGDEPTSSSTPYLGPILMQNSTVIRARVFRAGFLPSPVVTNSYFIGENVTLPVFSINTDSLNLWDYNTGIYTFGPNAQPNFPYQGANFWQDWQKEASIEYFDRDKNKIFNFDATIAIYGNYSRAQPQKSLEIRLSNRFGQGSISYPLIPDKPYIDKTDDIVLRNSGTDYNIVHFRDAFMERVLKNTHTGYIGAEPAVLFLNGQFWGVYTIHENHDHHWIENNFGYKEKEIDFIKEYGSTLELKAGTSDFFFNTYNYVSTADSSTNEFYQFVDSTWDLKNVLDYWIAETYYDNGDWIGDWTNNIKMWRPTINGGKMRYLVYDLDFGLGYDANYSENRLQKALHPTAFSYSSNLFNGFLRNARVKREFINRYADLMNTIFLPSKMLPIMHQFQDSMAYDMPAHFAKWGSNMTDWQNHINAMRNFIILRADTVRSDIVSEFGLQGKVSLTLNVTPANAGRIEISTVVPETYPWTGIYFNGNPVTITAIPNPGYTFTNWSSNHVIGPNDPSQITTYDFTSTDTIIAHFSGSPIVPKITISEFNYNSSAAFAADDWIELHNYGTTPINISGWQLKDENDYNTFVFPTNTVIAPNDYLVVAEDLTKFSEVYPGVTNVIGPLGFNLNNAGEQIRLLKNNGSVVVSFYYQDLAPWPADADGLGYTCEFSNNTADPADGANWFAGCLGGSPGREFSGALSTTAVVNGSTTFCLGGSVALATSYVPGYDYQWQRNNIDIPGATDTLLISSLAGTYKLKIVYGGCSTISAPIVVTVVTQGAAPIITASERCGEGPVTISAYAPDSIYWYASVGGPIIGYGPTFTTPYLNATQTFYAKTSLTCPSPLVSTNAVINAITANPVCPDQNRCGPGNVILNAVDTAEVRWYNALVGGANIFTGNFFVTGFIPHDTVYYMEAGTLCPSERLAVNVTVTAAPAPTSSDQARCGPGSLVLTALAADPIFWYDSYFGGNQVGSGINFLTPPLTETTTYYAEAVGACASERIPVVATVHDIPAPPVASDSTICGPGQAVLEAVSSGQVYWYDAPVGGNLLSVGSYLTTPPINSLTTFYASSFNICESGRTPASADVLTLPTITLGNDTAIETGTNIILDAGIHDSYLWSTGDSSQTIVVDSAADYSVIVTDQNGCSNSDSITITLFVNVSEANNSNGDLGLYPNPGKNQIQINIFSKSNQYASVSIINSNGQIVLDESLSLVPGKNNHQLNVSSLAAGVYFLQVVTKDNSKAVKLVIE
jgi:hypothetical protein